MKNNQNLKPSNKEIWIFNQFAGTPESGWGERHFYFSKYWKAKGYTVKIFSGSFNHVFKKNNEVKGLYKIESLDDVDFYWIKTPKYDPNSVMRFYSMLVFMYRIFLLPYHRLGKPGAIIVSSMPIFSILAGYFLKRKFSSRLIFEIRDIWPLTLQLLGNKSSWHPAVLFIGWFERFGYRNSDYIVSLLPNAQRHMEKVAGKQLNFHYIPNGIDNTQVGYEAIPKELELLIPKDKFIIGYAGTIGLANALEYFVEASILLKKYADIFFLVVGDGYLKNELLKKTSGSNNIIFFPKIKKSQIQDLLKYFDVAFVGRNNSPLFEHGVSANKYFDYMLAGKPILDSNNYIKDPVELSGGGIIVKPDSAEAIVQGILSFYNMSEDERTSMGNKGRVYAMEKHSIANLAIEYSTLFE